MPTQPGQTLERSHRTHVILATDVQEAQPPPDLVPPGLALREGQEPKLWTSVILSL